MIDHLHPYPEYRDSGVAWLGRVPTHWEVRRLRNVVDLRVSNVDKHSKEGEKSVRLCNYVDVYKHDRIRAEMEFMRATASQEEIARFRLQEGDVLITKDSESWNDIAVPALVESSAQDLVSGYHLALLRPREDAIGGAFLFRALQSRPVSYQFHVEAKGVTRYGLSHPAIKSVSLPLPPLPEQTAIVRFLDYADRRLRRVIRARRRLVKLLEEYRQTLIHQAVTSRIDVRTSQPYAEYKDSGVEWLGQVPAHWEVVPLKFLSRRVQNGSTPPTSNEAFYHAGTVPWYGPSSCGYEEQVGKPVRLLNEMAFQAGVARLISAPALLVVVIGATAGRMALLNQNGATNQQITAYELNTKQVIPAFAIKQLRPAESWLRGTASTATIPGSGRMLLFLRMFVAFLVDPFNRADHACLPPLL